MSFGADYMETLRALVDCIIPADDFPSGWQAGVGDFIEGILAADFAKERPLVASGLALLEQEARNRAGARFADLPQAEQTALVQSLLGDETTLQWGDVSSTRFIDLIIDLANQGFYSDPANLGNREGVSWQMIGYRPLPPGAHWPQIESSKPPTAFWQNIESSYDAIVVGSGAGGGIAACVLAEAGQRVLLVERGSWLSAADLPQNHLRNYRGPAGYETPGGPPAPGNPRVLALPDGDTLLWPTTPAWHKVAMTAGGGTRIYGAQAWRFCPEDFRMATTYGVPEGSSLADWPVSYEDMEPYYDRAEWEIGVSGDATGNKYAGPRRRGYPMPPVRPNIQSSVLARGAAKLGLSTTPAPLLVNSVPYNGRGACINCGACIGFGCPGEFKNDTRNTTLLRALATGRCDLLLKTQAERIVTDPSGVVTGVALATEVNGAVERRTVQAAQVLLGAGAVETARLLLNSKSRQEQNGLGNNYDQVGRSMQGHAYGGVIALFDEVVQDCLGPGPTITTHDYRHHNEGLVGGGMIANDFVPTPLNAWGTLTSLGAFPSWGIDGKRGMRDFYAHMALIFGPVQEMPNPQARVTLDPVVRDRFGVPVARFSGGPLPYDRNVAAFLSDRSGEWAIASGAKQVLPFFRSVPFGPSGGPHQAGTCRMGTEPQSSVTDDRGAVWGHDNLHIVDGSLHVTNGGVNPVLTIMALAYRVSMHVAGTVPARSGQRLG